MRADRLLSLLMLAPGARPADFDLAAFWQTSCAEQEANCLPFQATVRISPALAPEALRRNVADFAAQIVARYKL